VSGRAGGGVSGGDGAGAADGWVYDPPIGPLEVVYQDRDLVVVNKPSGLLSVPGRMHPDCVVSRLKEQFGVLYPVHRLDMDTSGLFVLALRRKAERALMQQFQERQISKTYIARVFGHPSQTGGSIRLALSRETGRPRSRVDADGKSAQTDWHVMRLDSDGHSRLSLHPRTGRSHQLRLHLGAIGHPILGDRFYAHPQALAAADRLCLHAAVLELAHPYSGAPLTFRSESDF
jgi:tRNA pseudouridine32 synthase/23S rRNA pseudouridine746 synthase